MPDAPTELVEPYAFVVPYCTCESADLFVCHVMRAVVLLIETVSVLETASVGVGAGDVDVAVPPVLVVVVAVCGELVESVEVEVLLSVGGVGSGSGVANVVNVSSPVMAALPEESITMTR